MYDDAGIGPRLCHWGLEFRVIRVIGVLGLDLWVIKVIKVLASCWLRL